MMMTKYKENKMYALHDINTNQVTFSEKPYPFTREADIKNMSGFRKSFWEKYQDDSGEIRKIPNEGNWKFIYTGIPHNPNTDVYTKI